LQGSYVGKSPTHPFGFLINLLAASSRGTTISYAAAVLWMAAGVGVVSAQSPSIVSPSPIGRFLLVASDGLYVVEPDGQCSWSHNPTPANSDAQVANDNLIYDGSVLSNGHYIFGTHRFVREIDREGKAIWEYRAEGTGEVKTYVVLPNANFAVLNSHEQAILEVESGTGKVLSRIPVPAQGNDHSRYNLLRRTPEGNYLVALRAEERFVEVAPSGATVPFLAERLSDGSTLCSGQFGVKAFDSSGSETWSFTPEDAAPDFKLIIAGGFITLPNQRLAVINSDWHYKKKGDNDVQLFVLDKMHHLHGTLQASALNGWKRSAIEPATGHLEHRCMVVQLIP
jgi:hypothetical protein